MSKVVVADELADQQHDVIALYMIALVPRDSLRVGADGKSFRLGVGDVIAGRRALPQVTYPVPSYTA